MSHQEVAVVGAGIVGLAHAWAAARRGLKVTVFERTPAACGASIRNFGMVWPIGQPTGESYATALQSRAAWLELSREAGVWVNDCGSIHLAHRDDEWAVLCEFAAIAGDLGYSCRLLTREEVLRRTPAANPNGLLGGLFSDTELGVNPRTAIGAIPPWLARRYGIAFEFNTSITSIEDRQLRSADGRTWLADQIIVCGGSDFETLFPAAFANAGLKRCKLQMMRTAIQPDGWRIGPHLASGLTLRHYKNFAVCQSLSQLIERIACETPELDQYGIHVMASQTDQGEVILGDSHEYDADISPFDKSVIDDLMLRELQKLIHLPSWTIGQRWHGIYAKHLSEPVFVTSPQPHVVVCTATGGSGMTMSFGLAERLWANWDADKRPRQ